MQPVGHLQGQIFGDYLTSIIGPFSLPSRGRFQMRSKSHSRPARQHKTLNLQADFRHSQPTNWDTYSLISEVEHNAAVMQPPCETSAGCWGADWLHVAHVQPHYVLPEPVMQNHPVNNAVPDVAAHQGGGRNHISFSRLQLELRSHHHQFSN